MPEAGPLGETFLDARLLAIVAASFLNRPSGGKVDSVLTFATHRFEERFDFAARLDLAALRRDVADRWPRLLASCAGILRLRFQLRDPGRPAAAYAH
jgi:hypothetical protein